MDRKTVNERLKKTIRKALLILPLAFVSSIIIYIIFGGSLRYVGIDINNLTYLQEYYDNTNEVKSDGNIRWKYNSDIFRIITIEDSTNRSQLANLIDIVCSCEPKVVGIDIRFKQNVDSGNTKLKSVVHKHADRIVLAQVLDENNQIMDNLFSGDSLCFGIANSYGFDRFPGKYITGNYDFSYEIAKKYKNDSALGIDFDQFVVNYSNTEFKFDGIGDIIDADKDDRDEYLKGKIVLIGSIDDIFDVHPIPFYIEGNKLSSGIKLHAYAINSLIKEKVPLRHLPVWSFRNIAICMIMIFLYLVVFVPLRDRSCVIVEKNNVFFTIIRALLLLSYISIILFFCYECTKYWNIIPNVVPFLISVFVINTFNDSLDKIINFKKSK